jgi:hypothetical protein
LTTPDTYVYTSELTASEIKAYMGCSRKWAAIYGGTGLWPRPEPKPYHTTGIILHKANEIYATTGQVPDDIHPAIREMAVDGLRYLPKPMSHTYVETPHSIEVEGLPFRVTPDWEAPTHIVDYKTAKDPHRWGLLTRDAKLLDPQTILYSYYLGRDVVFDHIYYRKTRSVLTLEGDLRGKGPTLPLTIPTPTALAASAVRDSMYTHVLPIAERIYMLRRKPISPLDMPPQTDHCRAFGGCPYIQRCFPTPQPGDESMSLLSQGLRTRLQSKVTPAPEPTATPPATDAGTPINGPVAEPAAPAEPPQSVEPIAASTDPLVEVLITAVSDAELAGAVRTLMRAWAEHR